MRNLLHSLEAILFLPMPCLAVTCINRAFGPKKTLICSELLARRVCWVNEQLNRHLSESEVVVPAQKWLRRMGCRIPFVSCLEVACALQLWLAATGIPSHVVVGRKLDGRLLRMHAWVETNEARYFYDDSFASLWRSDALQER